MSENLGLNVRLKAENVIQIWSKISTSVKMCDVAFCPADGANDGLISNVYITWNFNLSSSLIYFRSETGHVSSEFFNCYVIRHA